MKAALCYDSKIIRKWGKSVYIICPIALRKQSKLRTGPTLLPLGYVRKAQE